MAAERLAASVAPGTHGLRRAGSGEDFWQYRPAAAGETARQIDWRRSARSDEAFVRDLEAQTAQNATLWVSCGQGMLWSGDPSRETKYARAQLLALSLALVLLRGGERVAMLGDPPRAGRTQADQIARTLAMAKESAGDADAPDPTLLRGGQRVVLFGDFLAPESNPAPFLTRAAAAGVGGVLVQILDPDEITFPLTGALQLRSASGATRFQTRNAAAMRDAYLTRLSERRAMLGRTCEAAGWQFGTHDAGSPPAQALGWLSATLAG
ncbi:MAG: hypothetical protein DI498_07130 [Paracoccus denitrificans]|nr:MAG: hypothetical protein DI498_07130 [Paracoccus denitrificans]PZO84646.1 MAG: hypothetical protein DI633_07130 [Paracoccus denitrificans]